MSKLTLVIFSFCLLYFLQIEGTFIKTKNNVPRMGRSNEAEGPFDESALGYVIKTNKNIPRMGRRNYNSENRYDIPKLYQLPAEGGSFEDDGQLEAYFGNQMENMRK